MGKIPSGRRVKELGRAFSMVAQHRRFLNCTSLMQKHTVC